MVYSGYLMLCTVIISGAGRIYHRGTEPAKPHFLDGRPDPPAAWDLHHNLLLVQTQLGLPDHYHTTHHSDSSFHKKALEINYHFKGYQQLDYYLKDI